jgi:hypothetical protein
MKRLAVALIFSAAALAVTPARADSRVHIGVSIGSPVLHRPAPVIVAPAPVVRYSAPPVVMYAPPPAVVVTGPRGYWKEVPVKVWVPERWVVHTNRWGHAEQHRVPGYFAYRTERVWVDGRTHSRDGYGAHRYGYSYGRR